MRIEQWSIGSGCQDLYTPPEVREKVLQGKVYGHPRFENGQDVVTTGIVGVRGGLILTRSGSEYELGEPHPDYEAAYPNARARALAPPTMPNGTAEM